MSDSVLAEHYSDMLGVSTMVVMVAFGVIFVRARDSLALSLMCGAYSGFSSPWEKVEEKLV